MSVDSVGLGPGLPEQAAVALSLSLPPESPGFLENTGASPLPTSPLQRVGTSLLEVNWHYSCFEWVGMMSSREGRWHEVSSSASVSSEVWGPGDTRRFLPALTSWRAGAASRRSLCF